VIASDLNEYLSPPPDRVVDGRVLQLIADFVIPRVPGSRVLELGVGDRVWTRRLLEHYPDLTTIEGCPELLEAVTRELAPVNWTPIATLFEKYQPDGLFDAVYATGVLEHVEDPATLLSRLRGWLAPGGHLVVVVPHALSLHRRLGVKMGKLSHVAALAESDHRLGHHCVFTCHELERLLVESGLELVEKKGMLTKLLPNALMEGLTDDQLKGMFELGQELPMEYAANLYYLCR
jgi:trans-aconitate methyltransferase